MCNAEAQRRRAECHGLRLASFTRDWPENGAPGWPPSLFAPPRLCVKERKMWNAEAQRRGGGERHGESLLRRDSGFLCASALNMEWLTPAPSPGLQHQRFRYRSIGFDAFVANGSSTFLPVRADSYAAKIISSTALPSSPVSSGGVSFRMQSTKCCISCGKP